MLGLLLAWLIGVWCGLACAYYMERRMLEHEIQKEAEALGRYFHENGVSGLRTVKEVKDRVRENKHAKSS